MIFEFFYKNVVFVQFARFGFSLKELVRFVVLILSNDNYLLFHNGLSTVWGWR